MSKKGSQKERKKEKAIKTNINIEQKESVREKINSKEEEEKKKYAKT